MCSGGDTPNAAKVADVGDISGPQAPPIQGPADLGAYRPSVDVGAIDAISAAGSQGPQVPNYFSGTGNAQHDASVQRMMNTRAPSGTGALDTLDMLDQMKKQMEAYKRQKDLATFNKNASSSLQGGNLNDANATSSLFAAPEEEELAGDALGAWE